MPTFYPPVVLTGRRTAPYRHPGNALMRFYGGAPEGKSVLKIAGVYQSIQYPTQDQIDSATEFYQGGRVYFVSSATKTALEAAGYTVDAADPPATSSGGFATLPKDTTTELATLRWRDLEHLRWSQLENLVWENF